ncbi:MAG TPA: M48 family metallopeptidase [Coleofasciculaceae cyanobacterium]|jgi:Zn-dependent protease with chaperone function
MKSLNLSLILLNIFLFPTVTLAKSVTIEPSHNQVHLSQLYSEEKTVTERAFKAHGKDEKLAENSESETEEVEDDTSESEEDVKDKAKEPTPEEIARLAKLAQADRLYISGNKAAAVKLYREAKEPWKIEQEASKQNDELIIITFDDPAKLSPAGKVFWRNYQQGKERQLETQVISALKLLTTREPQFISGHIHYAEVLLASERETESLEVLNRAVNRYPNEPKLLRAKMNADLAAENWLDASIMARQFALFNPDSPQAEEFNRLAEEYLAEYQSNLRESITWNAIGNAIAGTVGFALTGNLFGPLSALETTSLLLRGESAVGEASVGQIKKQVPLVQNKKVTNYVDQIGRKIANASGREEFDYQFYIVMDDALNAFALPGGKVFVNAGAIMKTDSEAELAGLLAHEVSHSALSHGFQLATKGNLTANIVSYIPYVGNTASSLIVLNYSRAMEKQADIFGTRILVNAGYAADGVRNLMAQLDKSRDEDNSEPPAWLSSHPNTKQRIDYMERLIVDRNLNRYAYEGVSQHQEIKKLVTAKWQEYEKCVEEVDSIKEAKICAGEQDESQEDPENPTDETMENEAEEAKD